MPAFISFAVVFSPIFIFLFALALRVAAEMQPETSWSGKRRTLLVTMAYVLVLIGVLALIGLGFFVGPIVVIPLIVATLFLFQAVGIELRLQSSKRRSQEVEFLWVLATAVRANRDLADEVNAYARGSWGKRHEKLLDLAEHLRHEGAHSDLAVPQGLLPAEATLEIQAGLRTGNLAAALRSAAERQTRAILTREDDVVAADALVYPTAVIAVVVLVTTFVMYFIIPKFKRIFDEFGVELPHISKLLISISDFAITYWYFGFTLIAGIFLLFQLTPIFNSSGWPEAWKRLAGYWFFRPHASDILRSLSSTVAANGVLERAFDPFVTSSVPNLVQQKAASIRQALLSGESFEQVLERHGLLTTNEAVLLEAAKATGNLSSTMRNLAETLDRRITNIMTGLMELLRPVLIVLVGLVVGFIAVGIFMPLVKLLNDLS